MKIKKKLTSSLLALSLLGIAACSNNSSSGDASKQMNYVSVNGVEPQSPLIPSETNEIGGGRIVSSLFSGLTYIDLNTKTQMDLAESIESSDEKHYVVTLKDNIFFSDGTPIKAENFVRTWNYVVSNSHKLSPFYVSVEGFKELRDKKATEMSGLKVVNDRTFTIDLIGPDSSFTSQLAYSAFMPLPDIAFADIAAFGQNPVSSGPYKMAGPNAWVHNQSATLVVNEHYNGPRKAQNEGLKFIFYPTLSSAYADVVSNQLDVLDAVPDEQLSSYKSDFNNRWVARPAASNSTIQINIKTPHFGMDEEGKLRRAALSMAINRDEICDVIFMGTNVPAKDFSSPTVEGYNDHIQGNDVLTYQPQKARELWAKANAIKPFSGNVSLSYNADGGNQGWSEAVVNQWKNTLGVPAVTIPTPDFKSLLEKIRKREIPLAFRSGWVADYPSSYVFLQAVYTTTAIVDGGANHSDYSNPQFDQFINSAAQELDATKRQAYLDDAQTILMKDLPAIPLWVKNAQSVFSENVSNVALDWQGYPLYYQIHKK